MLLQFNAKLFKELVKKPEFVDTREKQAAYLDRTRSVRSSDFVFNLDVVNGVCVTRSVVTRSNWFFVLTNAAVYWEGVPVNDFPRLGIEFPMYTPSTPFNSEYKELNTVPSRLVFGCQDVEGKMNHYEEEKNVLYCLGKTFVVNLDVKAKPAQYARGYVVLSGLEIDVDGEA